MEIYTNCLFDTILSGYSLAATASLYVLHYLLLLICCIIQCGKENLKRVLYLFITTLSFSSLFEEITKMIIREYISIKERFFYSWIIFFVYSILFYMILKLLSNKDLREIRTNLKTLSDKIYLLILFDFFIAGGLASIQTAKGYTVYERSSITKALTIVFILLSIAIIITAISSIVSKNYYERQSALLEQQIETELRHYERIGVLDSELRNFRHDYKNHMLCIRSLAEEEQYDDLKDYISQITNNTIVNEKVYATGNKIADIILSEKNKKAEEHNCSISFLGEISEMIPSKDICIILSNSLDNAVEACAKNTSGSISAIKIKATFAHNMQLIEITNPVFDKIWIENKSVATTKSDKKHHGFGLHNIKRVTEEYDGIFDIHIEKGNFVLEVGLNLRLCEKNSVN